MKNSNREIKFRAWDKKQKKVFNNVSTGTISIWDDNNEAKSIDCEFMQYTGLKDANGIEIYVGDIIQLKNLKEWGVDVVVFYQGTFTTKNDGLGSGDCLYDIINHPDKNVGEVVGNIYKNPKLKKLL